jgi:hypothetical protein
MRLVQLQTQQTTDVSSYHMFFYAKKEVIQK